MFKRMCGIVTVILVACLATACGFGHQHYKQAGGALNGPNDYVIQVDDYGQLWDSAAADAALKSIAEKSRRTNTVVVLFVHGWHHNAKFDDSNAADFARSLDEQRRILDDAVPGTPQMFRRAREQLTNDGNIQVIGVYIGWRGRSLPSWLDYLTFWGRKAAAERVGEGDVRHFILGLNNIYRERNAEVAVGNRKPFMGLVSFGHSFGGQVLFKAVAATLEQELVEVASRDPAPANGLRRGQPLSGFGDLVVLINPALEALQYDRIETLGKALNYDRNQVPLFVVLSSETDKARQIAFPVGRWLARIGRAPHRDDRQAEMWMNTLGEFEPQQTHRLALPAQGDATPVIVNATMYANKCSLISQDIGGGPWKVGGLVLSPKAGRAPYSPFLVVYVDGQIIVKHNGIFHSDLHGFLTEFVAMVEGKRILLANMNLTCP